MPELSFLWVVVFLALAFDYINGFHDTANAIATSVSTRALQPQHARARGRQHRGAGRRQGRGCVAAGGAAAEGGEGRGQGRPGGNEQGGSKQGGSEQGGQGSTQAPSQGSGATSSSTA